VQISYGVSWDDRKGKISQGILAALIALAVVSVPASPASIPETIGRIVSVIVRENPGSGAGPEEAVRALDGEVGRHIRIINGFVAELPESRVARLAAVPGVHSVTPDARVRLLHHRPGHATGTWWDAEPGSLKNIAKLTGAWEMWESGFTGTGVDVALIDSGVVPVEGLTAPGKVVNGADLSFEAPAENLRYLDTFGHGTHMAGIIAGRDTVTPFTGPGYDGFVGIAPNARILNVKVANALGATDVSQVLAAIDWVVQHRNDNGMNIRVLNLSFGTNGTQDYMLDPLAFAAEVAWRQGIVVVVAAGNTGFGSAKLNNPAYDPFVIAVGATDTKGTLTMDDDVVPSWSAKGDANRRPDLVAPGASLVSLRDPGSYIDVQHPTAVFEDRFFKGTGTSQAAAVVSGATALLIQQRPGITPDQVKALLTSTATPLKSVPAGQGAGQLNLATALHAPTPNSVQTYPQATGTGSLEAARGTVHVVADGVELAGEQDIFGATWDGVSWSTASLAGVSWSGGTWNGNDWTGVSWSGVSWSGVSWSGVSWSGVSWSGVSWSGVSWSGVSWSGVSWSGVSWSGVSWSGVSWSGVSWSGVSWSSDSWG
jgi:serine protease AprX